ncbi:type III secretion system export apparatus subunit SctT [Dickeya oryzae]|uniref:Type III secretion system export apparatus subunit SctT n=1 Tax=Dickeya oryzae TaxID=1240404 RepID=A0AB39IN34_9GAMM|nr:type III secretion system export apparatus subunit SctT [Dickeya oryzae]MBP2851510.1 type III secretion system export apparatus subunit SctT [Dickeya oryzae]MCA6992544.1 type III secretion system export apparatus subunit SctT [Dickeya oryzae]MCA6996341.1 type III secretion system export apparatus subunit SctT [Dickeya oryzae]
MLSLATLQSLYDFIYALTLGVARLYPCLFLVPLFSFTVIKGMLRNAVALAIALVPAAAIQQHMLTTTITWPMLPALLLKELVIGLLLGVVLAMPFWLFESVGALFDNQRGALTGGQLNPALGSDATPLGHMMKELFTLLLIITIGFSGFTQLLWDSYRLWPALDFLPPLSELGFHTYLGLLNDTFQHMIVYAGPLVTLLLLLEFSIAILSLYSPQLQVYVLSAPAKCLAGMAFFVLYMPVLQFLGEGRLKALADLKHLFPLFFQVSP